MKIAIDGPSGAGKSYLSKTIAAHYGFIHVDTGALYRTLGLYALRAGIARDKAAEICPHLEKIEVSLSFTNEGQRVLLNGEDVTDLIRTPEISMYASAVSAVPAVRDFLLETQRSIARVHSVVMDGRDIGTVILPDAEVKIFLVANDKARAKRRLAELEAKGIQTTLEEVLADMAKRDENDRTRATAPAIAAEDAVLLDNSELTRDQTVEAAIRIIEEKRQK